MTSYFLTENSHIDFDGNIYILLKPPLEPFQGIWGEGSFIFRDMGRKHNFLGF